MYRVIKPQGYDTNVTIENTETLASVVIGRLDTKMLDILDSFHVEYPSAPDEWNFEVNKETASELVAFAMKIKKPIRDQRKKPEDKPTGKVGVDVDAFDLIYGI